MIKRQSALFYFVLFLFKSRKRIQTIEVDDIFVLWLFAYLAE